MNVARLALLFSFSIWPTFVYADIEITTLFTGNDLMAFCSPAISNSCRGYVAGISDAMANTNPVAGHTACVPKGVTLEQLTDVTITYLRSHANMRHYSAASQVAAAISEGFPCH
jgi:hypothetical protein